MSSRGPRTVNYTDKEMNEILNAQTTRLTYSLAIKRGMITGIVIYLIQLIIFTVVILINRDILYIQYFNFILSLEMALFFVLSGFAIWFEPSPTWGRMKATLINKPFIQKSIGEAYRTGLLRSTIAIMLLIFIEIHGFLINLFF